MSVVKIVNLSGIPVITEFECKRVKNINVRVRNDGSLYCSYPKHVSQSRAQSFVETSAGQLLRAIDAANRRRVESLGAAGLQDSMQVKVFGRYMPIIIEENSCTGCSSGSGSVVVRVSDRNDFAAVCALYDTWRRNELERYVRLCCDSIYPYFLSFCVDSPSKIRFAEYKSFWGECLPGKSTLKFSYRLFEVPTECIEYVVAHEFAHFLQPNHSEHFWALVENVIPDCKQRRRRLNAV